MIGDDMKKWGGGGFGVQVPAFGASRGAELLGPFGTRRALAGQGGAAGDKHLVDLASVGPGESLSLGLEAMTTVSVIEADLAELQDAQGVLAVARLPRHGNGARRRADRPVEDRRARRRHSAVNVLL